MVLVSLLTFVLLDEPDELLEEAVDALSPEAAEEAVEDVPVLVFVCVESIDD